MNVEKSAVASEMELTAVELELVNGGTEQDKQNLGANLSSSLGGTKSKS